MNGPPWLARLRQQSATKTQAQVAHEIGYSAAVVSQVLSGSYKGSLDNVAARVAAVYGEGGQVACPALGMIDPGRCADTWERAQKIGVGTGNPNTARLHKACLRCPVRA